MRSPHLEDAVVQCREVLRALTLCGTAMAKVDYRNIEKVEGRCGGRAVVSGTRIRVSLILACYRQGMTVEEIVSHYPHLTPGDVHDALAYAYEHPAEIEADLAADQEDEAQQRWPDPRGRP